MTLILVTNDDGVHAPGLKILFNETKKIRNVIEEIRTTQQKVSADAKSRTVKP